MNTSDLLNVYRSSSWSILEYAVQVWQDIPEYLCNSIESIQKRAFNIIYPDCSCDKAQVLTNEDTLWDIWDSLCQKFLTDVAESREHSLPFLVQLPMLEPIQYNLRSGATQPTKPLGRTKRFNILSQCFIVKSNTTLHKLGWLPIRSYHIILN